MESNTELTPQDATNILALINRIGTEEADIRGHEVVPLALILQKLALLSLKTPPVEAEKEGSAPKMLPESPV
jgi:hypothetical protein